MNYWLMDYENVNAAGFDGLKNLTADDNLIVFYSVNANSLTFELHQRINKAKANIDFQRVPVGSKNALDFQLSSYLGYLICDTKNTDSNYYIVSNDLGYAILTNYWKGRGTEVTLVKNLAKENPKQTETKNSNNDNHPKKDNAKEDDTKEKLLAEAKEKLTKLLGNASDTAEVIKIINHYKTKQGVNNGLTQKFKNQSGEIHKIIKPLLADKKGS